jgi:hypothetical protein
MEYEYKIERIGDPAKDQDQVHRLLNEHATSGWRLVAVTSAKYGLCGIFEREIMQPQPKVIWLDLGLDLTNILEDASDNGEWDGSFEQLQEIADGSRKVTGIGPRRRERLAELIAEVK